MGTELGSLQEQEVPLTLSISPALTNISYLVQNFQFPSAFEQPSSKSQEVTLKIFQVSKGFKQNFKKILQEWKSEKSI